MKKEKKQKMEYHEVTHHMIVTMQMHHRMMEKNLDGTGVHRAQHRLLMTLSDGTFRSQVELAKHLEVTPATIAVSLKKLEQESLIRKTAKKEDNRANFVELTEKGKRMVENSRDFFDSVDQAMYQGFTQEELVLLCNYLDRIYDNMNQM